MPVMLDTNMAIYAQNGDARVWREMARHEGGMLLSALSLVELLRGLAKEPALAAARRARLDPVLDVLTVVPFDEMAARAYGDIVAQRGCVRSRDFDRMIAGHAVATRSTLVTHNVTDFADVPNLSVIDWLAEA